MRSLLIILCLFSLAACKKSKSPSNAELIIGKWATTSIFVSGGPYPGAGGAKPIFEFAGDGKMYFTPTPGLQPATFSYQFVSSSHIQINGASYDLRIDALTDKIFYFTVTDNQLASTGTYQTVRQ